MNFGADFEDDFFEKPREKKKELAPKRGAKICPPLWFMDAASTSEEDEELLKCLRYKADYLYFTKEFAEASKAYEKCLHLLPASNIPGKREIMENLARSLLHQGLPESALEWALRMHAAAVSADQRLVSWSLLATVCHTLGKYEEELEALHCCLDSHKSNPDFWLRLAYCYSGLLKIYLPDSGCECRVRSYCCAFQSRTATSDNSEERCVSQPEFANTGHQKPECSVQFESENSSHTLSQADEPLVDKCEICILGIQIISACVLKTRLLLSNYDRSHVSKEKSSRMNEKITACLTHMEVEKHFIDEASRLLKTELFNGLPVQKETFSLEQPTSTNMEMKGNAESPVTSDT